MGYEQELLEQGYPLLVHEYSITRDSGVSGRFRGGCGTTCEVEPIDHEMTVVVWGDVPIDPAQVATLIAGRFGWRVGSISLAGAGEARHDAAAIQGDASGLAG